MLLLLPPPELVVEEEEEEVDVAALAAPAALADAGGSCHFHGNKPAAEATVSNCASTSSINSVATP